MKTLDKKISFEIQNLPEEMKQKVLGYIQGIKIFRRESDEQITSKPGHGGAQQLLKYVPDNLEKISVAEDF